MVSLLGLQLSPYRRSDIVDKMPRILSLIVVGMLLVACTGTESVDLSRTLTIDASCESQYPDFLAGDRWDDGADAIVFLQPNTSALGIATMKELLDNVEAVESTRFRDQAYATDEVRERRPEIAQDIPDMPARFEVRASEDAVDLGFRDAMRVIESRSEVFALIERVDACLEPYLTSITLCDLSDQEADVVVTLLPTSWEHGRTTVEKALTSLGAAVIVEFVDAEAALHEVAALIDVDLVNSGLGTDDTAPTFRVRTDDPQAVLNLKLDEISGVARVVQIPVDDCG